MRTSADLGKFVCWRACAGRAQQARQVKEKETEKENKKDKARVALAIIVVRSLRALIHALRAARDCCRLLARAQSN